MSKTLSHKQYLDLVEEMIEHDRRYYDENKPMISDYEYDQKMGQLKGYEKAHPEDVHPHSPAQRVAEGQAEGFVQKKHLTPMMSLANTYSEKEVEDFLVRVNKLLEKNGKIAGKISYCCELKMDGTAISLRYKKGKLFHALTRGNGSEGDDVTANIKTIRSIPLHLSGTHIPDDVEVRGEVFLSLASFRAINAQKQEAGEEMFANPRNAAAGSLKILDSKEVAKRKLDIVCYGVGNPEGVAETQDKVQHLLKKWGFPTASSDHICLASTLHEIMHFAKRIEKQRDKLPFEIDGIVVKVNELEAHPLLGSTGKTPRFAIAYKFAPEQAKTRIVAITVQVGRTGVLTPVAELEPVFLAGSTISRATLHNQEEVARKDIRIGDLATIEKGGDVIPKVVSVDPAKRGKHSAVWHMPHKCPVCHTPVVHHKGEVAVRCPNPHCGGQKVKRIIHFASKHAMDIEHMGEKVVEMLVEKGIINRISDIYLLNHKHLENLEGFKEKSIQNLLDSIDVSRKCSLSRFLMGLGIKYVGTETADALAEEGKDLETLMHMSEEEFNHIEGIGEKTAVAIYEFFQSKENREEIKLLLTHGVRPQKLKARPTNHPFSGKTFVLTGTLHDYSREEATELIKERGGKVSGSVSKQTDFVLVGESAGSKYDKAKELGIHLLTEKQFKDRL